MNSSPTRDHLSATALLQLAITFARHYGLPYSRPAIGPSSWSHRNISASFLPRTDSHRPVSLNDLRWCGLGGKILIPRLSLKYCYTLSILVMASNMEFKFFNVFLPIPSPKRTWDSPFYVKNNSFFFCFLLTTRFFSDPVTVSSRVILEKENLWSHWHTVKSAPITSTSRRVIDTFGSACTRAETQSLVWAHLTWFKNLLFYVLLIPPPPPVDSNHSRTR